MIQQVSGHQNLFVGKIDDGVPGGISASQKFDFHRTIAEIDVEFTIEDEVWVYLLYPLNSATTGPSPARACS